MSSKRRVKKYNKNHKSRRSSEQLLFIDELRVGGPDIHTAVMKLIDDRARKLKAEGKIP